MKKLSHYYRFVLVLVASIMLSCVLAPLNMVAAQAAAKPEAVTTIYVLRHGEKADADPTDQDPALSPEGEARAKELVKYLAGKKVDAVYATPFKRTQSTVQPLAEKNGLTIQTYNPRDNAGLKNQVLQHHTGKPIVIAGHSNTILAIVEAFGAKKPFEAVADSKYDHIFKITVGADGTATVEPATYGAATN